MSVREKGWEPAAVDLVECEGRRVGGISAAVAAVVGGGRWDGFVGWLGEDEERDIGPGGGVALRDIRDGERLRREESAGKFGSILSKVDCGSGKFTDACGRGPLGCDRMGMGADELLSGELGGE